MGSDRSTISDASGSEACESAASAGMAAGELSRRPHIGALDAIRGLAIALVLAYHFTIGMTADGIAGRLALKLAATGWCGVDLFFVLSGFLITGILHDSREAPHRFRNFYARRALRIFPLYYGSLVVVLLLRRAVGEIPGFEGVDGALPWLWAYGANVLAAIRDSWFPLGHFWSLSVEEHFYIIWPAVVFLCSRRAAMGACLAMVAIATSLRAYLVYRDQTLAAYCLTPCRIDALAMGGLVALAVRGPGGIRALIPAARKALLIGGATLTALAGCRFGLAFHDPYVQIHGYLALDLAFAGAIVLAVAAPDRSLLATACQFAPLRILGRYSYGLYVYNSMFLLLAEGSALLPRLIVWTGAKWAGQGLYSASLAAVTVTTAVLSWHLIEEPLLRLKRYVPSGPSAAEGSPPSASLDPHPTEVGQPLLTPTIT